MLTKFLRAAGGKLPIQYVGSGFSSFLSGSLSGGIASSASAGDLVIAFFAIKDGTDRLALPGGYGDERGWTTRLLDLYANDTNDVQLFMSYKVITQPDNEGTREVYPNWVGGGLEDVGFIRTYVFRNVDPYIPIEVITSTTAINTGVPNAPSITTLTNNAVVGVVGAAAGGTGALLSDLTVPSGMENFTQTNQSDLVCIGLASILQPTAGAYDPPAFGGGSTNTANSMAAASFSIRQNQGLNAPQIWSAKFTVTSGTSATISSSFPVSKPPEGALIFAFICADGSTTSWGAPSGWTNIYSRTASPAGALYYKVATASEPDTYTFTSGTSRGLTLNLTVYTNASYDAIGTAVSGSSTLTPSGPTAAANNSYLLGFAHTVDQRTISCSTMNQTSFYRPSLSGESYIITRTPVPTAGSTGSHSFVTGTASSSAVLLTIKPAS